MQRGMYPVKLRRISNQPKQIGGGNSKALTQFNQSDQRAKQQRHQPKMVIRRESQRRGGGNQDHQWPVQHGMLPILFEFAENVHCREKKIRGRLKIQIQQS